jgi:hypothetical protein
VRVGRPTGSLTFAGLAGHAPTLRLRISAPTGGPGLKRASIRLPGGLRVVSRSLARGLIVRLDGHALARTASISSGSLVIALGSGSGHTAAIALTSPALRVANALVSAIRHHRARRLTVPVTIIDSSGRVTKLRLVAGA